MSEFRNANFAYVPLTIPAVHPAVSVARAICLLFVSPRQMEFLSTKKEKLLPGQAWLRAERGSALVCRKSVSFTECLELTANAGISSRYVSIQRFVPFFLPSNLFVWLCPCEDP